MEYILDQIISALVSLGFTELQKNIQTQQSHHQINEMRKKLQEYIFNKYNTSIFYESLDKFFSERKIIENFIVWSKSPDVTINKEIDKLVKSNNIHIPEKELKGILLNLYICIDKELNTIDDPDIQKLFIKLSQQARNNQYEAQKDKYVSENPQMLPCKEDNIISEANLDLNTPTLEAVKVLDNQLNRAFKREKQRNPSIDYKKYDKGMILSINIDYDTIKIRTKNNRKTTFKEFLHKKQKARKQNHICVTGIGGIGKTVSLFESKYLSPAIYIPLRYIPQKSSENHIESYIKQITLSDNQNEYETFQYLCNKDWNGKANIIIILDGINELTPCQVDEVISELKRKWLLLPGIQFIITSRYDVSTRLNSHSFSKISVLPLSKSFVRNFLHERKFKIPKETDTLWKVIDTPLMLKLYSYSEEVKSNRKNELISWRDNKNAGSVIWNYFQSELANCDISSSHDTVVAMFLIAPYISYEMVNNHCYIISRSGFRNYVNSAITYYNMLRDSNQLPNIIYESIERCSGSNINNSVFYNILVNQLNIFVNKNNNLQLTHQHFRDCLAAIHIIHRSDNANTIPNEWLKPFDYNVEHFLSDLLITEKESMSSWYKMWDLISQMECKTDDYIKQMLHLFGLSNNDISSINFKNIDLSRIYIANFQLNDNSKSNFINSKLGLDTFLGNGHLLTVSSVSWSYQNEFFISASHDRSIRIYNTKANSITILNTPHEHYIRCAACCPNNEKIIASAGDDKNLIIWKFDSKNNENSGWDNFKLGECSSWIRSLDWSSDGQKIACGDGIGNIRLFNMTNNESYIDFEKRHKNNIRNIKWSSNNEKLISGDEDGIVCIWDINGKCLKTIDSDENMCTGIAWLFGNTIIIISSRNTIKFYLVAFKYNESDISHCEMQEIKKISYGKISYACVLHDDNYEYLAVFCNNDVIVSRILFTNNELVIDEVCTHSFSEKINRIICADGKIENGELTIVCGARDGNVGQIKIQINEEIENRIEAGLIGIKRNQSARCSCWSQDGRKLAVGYDDCKIRIWDPFEGKCLCVLSGHTDSIKCLNWSPDGQKLVSGSDDNSVCIWSSLLSNKIEIKKIFEHKAPVNSVLWLKNGSILSAGDDKSIVIINFNDNKPLARELKPVHEKRIYSMACCPQNENYIISGGNDTYIVLWNLEDGTYKRYTSYHTDSVRAISWSRDGKFIISSSNDGLIISRLFDNINCELDTKITKLPKRQNDFIYGADISSNNKYIIGGCTDSTISFWSAVDKTFISTVKEHENFVWHVSSSPQVDGKYYIATSSSDGTVRIWDVTKITTKDIQVNAILPVIPNADIVGCDFSGATMSSNLKKLLAANGGIID